MYSPYWKPITRDTYQTLLPDLWHNEVALPRRRALYPSTSYRCLSCPAEAGQSRDLKSLGRHGVQQQDRWKRKDANSNT
jgi:hypothetical protein